MSNAEDMESGIGANETSVFGSDRMDFMSELIVCCKDGIGIRLLFLQKNGLLAIPHYIRDLWRSERYASGPCPSKRISSHLFGVLCVARICVP